MNQQGLANVMARSIADAVAPLVIRISELEAEIGQLHEHQKQQAADTRAAVTAGLEAVDDRWTALADYLQRGLNDAER